jgi:hypothetical protein
MIRGTTPTHVFKIPIDPSMVASVRVVYAQDDAVIVKKCTDDCTFDGNIISVTLTQEDTLLFDCKKCVQIQIRVLTIEGESLSTRPMSLTVEKCLDGEVLS